MADRNDLDLGHAIPEIGMLSDRFYSVAVDKAGNQEPAPDTADAKVRLKRRRR